MKTIFCGCGCLLDSNFGTFNSLVSSRLCFVVAFAVSVYPQPTARQTAVHPMTLSRGMWQNLLLLFVSLFSVFLGNVVFIMFVCYVFSQNCVNSDEMADMMPAGLANCAMLSNQCDCSGCEICNGETTTPAPIPECYNICGHGPSPYSYSTLPKYDNHSRNSSFSLTIQQPVRISRK